jgi:FtsP/CotA-like multicopper oxidase with cupredoxin domain
MSNGARIGVVLATVLVLVVAFVLLSPEADDDSNTAQTPTTTTQTPTSTVRGPAITTTTSEPPAADHEPAFETINVAAGKPDGGVQTITVKKGSRARIQVASQDTSDEIHLHGYDLTRQLKAGDSVRFSFDADAEGIFEIELHGTHTQIGKLVVEP